MTRHATAFFAGATALLAAYLMLALLQKPVHSFSGSSTLLWFALFVPVVEEHIKYLFVRFMSRSAPETPRGFLAGAALGLGFASGETVLRLVALLDEPHPPNLIFHTLLLRLTLPALMHATTAGTLARGQSRGRNPMRSYALPMLLAIALHATYNIAILTIAEGA